MADQITPEQDTRTRKTVRLHTIPPAAQDGQKAESVIRDPLTARDTDTGNLEILSDTQTRRTLKLKPIAPGAKPAVQLNITPESSDTRKTVMLHPVAATDKTATAPIPAPAAHKTIPMPPGMSSSAAPKPLEKQVEVSDKTAAVPRPAVKPAESAVEVSDKTAAVPRPAVKSAESAVEVSDKTAAVPRPAVEAQDSDDQTVKLKRPLNLAPPPGPAAGDQKATVKLPTPKLPSLGLKPPTLQKAAPAPAPAPAPAAAPKPAPAPAPAPKPAPAPAPEADSEADQAPSNKINLDKNEKTEEKTTQASAEEPNEISLDDTLPVIDLNKDPANDQQGKGKKGKSKPGNNNPENGGASVQKPSAVYLILTAIALIFVIASGVITCAHYLDFCQGKKIYDALPGLPVAK